MWFCEVGYFLKNKNLDFYFIFIIIKDIINFKISGKFKKYLENILY